MAQGESNHDALDDSLPHEPERCDAQERGILHLLAPPPKRVLEIGCGQGRLVAPLAREGHCVVGVDRNARALDACRAALEETNSRAELIEDDFHRWTRASKEDASFDAILCVGNTLMTVADLDDAVDLLEQVARLLAPQGIFILDDVAHDLWPLLTEGEWTSGVSEDGSMQLIWHGDDSVFTIRRGPRVDHESWTFEKDDELYRLWTSGSLRLAARLAGLSEPQRLERFGLLVLRRADQPDTGVKGHE